jgi:hypothetical protein
MAFGDGRKWVAAAAACAVLLLGAASLAGCGKKDEVAGFEKPTPPTAEETRRMEEALKQAPGGGVPDAGIPR